MVPLYWRTFHPLRQLAAQLQFESQEYSLKRIFFYNRRPVLLASLLPNRWSHRALRSVRWKIFTFSFADTLLVFCGLSWFGYCSLSKSGIFSKSRKWWKLTNFTQWRNSTFRKLFFKWLPFLEKSGYWHETKARWSSKHQIFMGRKKLVDLSNHF